MRLFVAAVGLVGVVGLGATRAEGAASARFTRRPVCFGLRECDPIYRAIGSLRADSVKLCHDMGEQAYLRFMYPIGHSTGFVPDSSGTITFLRGKTVASLSNGVRPPPDSAGLSHVGHPGSLESQIAANEAEALGLDPAVAFRTCGHTPTSADFSAYGVGTVGVLRKCSAEREVPENGASPFTSVTAGFDSARVELSGLNGTVGVVAQIVYRGKQVGRGFMGADAQRIRHEVYATGCTPARAVTES